MRHWYNIPLAASLRILRNENRTEPPSLYTTSTANDQLFEMLKTLAFIGCFTRVEVKGLRNP